MAHALPQSKTKKWADIEAEDDFDHSFDVDSAFESKVDRDGVKTVTTYTRNAKGEHVKVIKKVKVRRKAYRTNKAVFTRKQNMENSGFFVPDREDDGTTVRTPDEYIIEIPKNSRLQQFKRSNDEFDAGDFYFLDIATARPNREFRLKFKALREEDEPVGDSAGGQPEGDTAEDDGNRYIPPAKRGLKDGMDGTRRGGNDEKKEECTVRVTNLSEDVKESDLTELFQTAGKIQRVFLAKHKETKFSKGFAFVTYANRSDAARAIEKLNRHGYDNLLLNVEWAKPSGK